MILVFLAQELYTRISLRKTGSSAMAPPIPLDRSAVLAELVSHIPRRPLSIPSYPPLSSPSFYYSLPKKREKDGIEISWLFWESAHLGVVYSLGDWLWYIGLPHTSVSLGTCIFNSACIVSRSSIHTFHSVAALTPSFPLILHPIDFLSVHAPISHTSSSLSVVLRLFSALAWRAGHRVPTQRCAFRCGGGDNPDTRRRRK